MRGLAKWNWQAAWSGGPHRFWSQVGGRAGAWSRELGQGVLNLLFPPICPLCSQAGHAPVGQMGPCAACREEVESEIRDRVLCTQCALPLTPTGYCSSCAQRGYRFHETRTIGLYRGPLQQAVRALKHPGQEALALALGHWLGAKIGQQPWAHPIDFIVPTPMHWTRRWQRGANNPELLCEALSGSLGRPWYGDLIRFRRATRKQGTLVPTERIRNVRGAFGVTAAYVVDGAHVLLVDDVMTTGATLNEITKTLLKAGAARVSVAVVARAVGADR